MSWQRRRRQNIHKLRFAHNKTARRSLALTLVSTTAKLGPTKPDKSEKYYHHKRARFLLLMCSCCYLFLFPLSFSFSFSFLLWGNFSEEVTSGQPEHWPSGVEILPANKQERNYARYSLEQLFFSHTSAGASFEQQKQKLPQLYRRNCSEPTTSSWQLSSGQLGEFYTNLAGVQLFLHLSLTKLGQ